MFLFEQPSYDMLRHTRGHVLTDFMLSRVVSCTVHFCTHRRTTPVVLCCLHMLFFTLPMF